MPVGRSRFRGVGGFVLLMFLLGVFALGHANDRKSTDISRATYEPLRLPKKQWVSLLVNREEYYPIVAYADRSSAIRSLAVLPGVFVQIPERVFRPYVGTGVGLSLNRLLFDTPLAPSPLRLAESLVVHVESGFTYELEDNLSLIADARFVQFSASDLLDRFAPVTSPQILDGLDFSSYTLQLGIRLGF